MSEIFKVLCQDTTNEMQFGLCDDRPHQRAYLDEQDGQKWIAIVRNYFKREIVFTALDNCIEFNKANGKSESRCEGVLTYADTIIFVELKERSGDAQTWAKTADNQLRNSITIVTAKVDLSRYIVKKAYICNREQKKLNESYAARSKKFLNDTGFVLRIERFIKIE